MRTSRIYLSGAMVQKTPGAIVLAHLVSEKIPERPGTNSRGRACFPQMPDGELEMKIVHFAKYISNKGDVSPACADPPRKLKLKTETWTNRINAVTCPNCKAMEKAK